MADQKTVLLLENMLEQLQLKLETDPNNKLALYSRLLIEGLAKQRLIGDKSLELIIGKHFYDSLYPLILQVFPDSGCILDLGSGGGLPGIPLKICLEKLSFSFLDSNRRKQLFLETAAKRLGLTKVEFLLGRAEVFGQLDSHREKYDLVVSRAVAEMAVLAELALPFVKRGSRVLLYKGPGGEKEYKRAARAIMICGGELERKWRYRLPTGEHRILYSLLKVTNTPQRYPRRAGQPASRPII